jgi:hypothetical protein
MPLSKLISIPFAIILIIFLYLTWIVDSSWSLYILIGFLPLALFHIMSAEIDWWWFERHPPELEAPMAEILERGLPFYQSLEPAGQLRFRQKVAMFIIGNEWIPQVWETIPRDVQVAIAAQAVIPLYDRKEWLYPNWETIVVHPAGFMSPSFPFTHYSELFEEDKCVLFSAEHVLRPIMMREKGLLIGLYEYQKLAAICFSEHKNKSVAQQTLSPEELVQMARKATGVPNIDLVAAAESVVD